MVEESLMACHTVEHARELAKKPIGLSQELRQKDRRQLDDAVLQLLGVTDPVVREEMLNELYLETARHYRQIRVMEIQKQVQRAGGGHHKLTAEDIAGSIWDSLDAAEQGPKLMDWLMESGGDTEPVSIPDGKARALGRAFMFSPSGVDFTQGNAVLHETYAHPDQGALVATLANLEIRGKVEVPKDAKDCKQWNKTIASRLSAARTRFEELAGSRTGDEKLRDGTVAVLMQWLVHGRERVKEG